MIDNLYLQKRLLINSCFQHAAAALNLKSTVCWITTSPKVFGYDMHDNIFPVEEKMRQYNGAGIDNFLFSYDLQGHEYEFPLSDYQIFNLQEVYDSLTQNEATDF